MDRQAIVLEVLAKISGRELSQLKPELDLVADLGVDSPKALHLLCEMEERLGVEISEDQAARMNTVGDVLAFAESLG